MNQMNQIMISQSLSGVVGVLGLIANVLTC